MFVCDHLNGGGAELFTIELIKFLQGKNYKIKLLLLERSDIRIDVSGIDVCLLDIKLDNSVLRNKGKKISKEKIDLLKSFEVGFSPDYIFLCSPMSFWLYDYFSLGKVYMWLHSNFFDFNLHSRIRGKNFFKLITIVNEFRKIFLEKLTFRSLFENRNIIVVSSDLYDFLSQIEFGNSVYLIENGLPLRVFEKRTINNKKKFDAIFVGRLEADKRVDLIIKYFSDSGLNGKLAILGDGTQSYYLKAYARSLGLEDKIVFLGWAEDPYEIMLESSMLLLASKYETFGLVVTEAHILGIPVVALNCSYGVERQFLTIESKRGLINNMYSNEYAEAMIYLKEKPYIIPIEMLEFFSLERVLCDLKKLII